MQIYLTCERWRDEDGRWIPFASKWLESYEADPPPALKKHRSSRQPASDEEYVEYTQMYEEFRQNAVEINDALVNGRPLSKRHQQVMDYFGAQKMTPPKPSSIQELAARALVRRYLSPSAAITTYLTPRVGWSKSCSRLASAWSTWWQSSRRSMPNTLLFARSKRLPFNLRRALPAEATDAARTVGRREYGPPDPEWSRNLLKTATGQVSAIDKKAQYKAERYNMRLQALKDSVFYSTPAGQAEIRAIVGKDERNASRTFWGQALARNEKAYPAQIAAIRAGREPQFNDAKPEAIPMRPITAESFKGIEPMRVEKCTTCGGTGRLAGDIYCDDCQTGRDLRKMETSYGNGGAA